MTGLKREQNELSLKSENTFLSAMIAAAPWMLVQERVPTPGDLVESLAEVLVMPRDKEVTVMLEPGRAILGNAGALLTTVLGCKTSGSTTSVHTPLFSIHECHVDLCHGTCSSGRLAWQKH